MKSKNPKLQKTGRKQTEGVDYVSCKICGKQCKRLMFHLNKVHNLLVREYLAKFLDAPLTCLNTKLRILETRNARYSYSDIYTPERAGKISAKMKGNKNGAGWVRTAAHRKKYSEAQLRLCSDPEYVKKRHESWQRALVQKDFLTRETEPLFRGGFREDLGKSFRSSWEANLARVLRYARVRYIHEPKRYIIQLSGVKTSYLPDFYLPSYALYVEVRGSYPRSADALKKVKVFEKSYKVKVLIVDDLLYRRIENRYATKIRNWEHSGSFVPKFGSSETIREELLVGAKT